MAGNSENVRKRAHRGPGKRLTLAERYEVLEAHRAHPDWSMAQLSENVGVNPKTCRLICLAGSKTIADLMAGYAEPVLRDWIRASRTAGKRGDHRPARDYLLHAGALEPLPETARGGGPAVVIVNNPLPGMPGVPLVGRPTMAIGTVTIDGENPAPASGSAPPVETDRTK
jgi:hypothetical protein